MDSLLAQIDATMKAANRLKQNSSLCSTQSEQFAQCLDQLLAVNTALPQGLATTEIPLELLQFLSRGLRAEEYNKKVRGPTEQGLSSLREKSEAAHELRNSTLLELNKSR